MTNTIHYTHCPGCGSASISPVITAFDYLVSQESYTIWECKSCTLRFTQDVPDINGIKAYYKSENYISHTNTSKGFINKLYHGIRKFTLRQKRNMVVKATGISIGNLLDVGSGTGAFVHVMKKKGWQVTGIEPDETARQTALKLYAIELSNSDMLFQLPQENFDAITLWHVLEHVHDLHGYMSQLQKILKPQGKIFIALPNYTSKDEKIYRQYWAAYDVPRHLYHFSPAAVKKLAEKHNLVIENYKPMWFDSFYISLLSSRYKNKSKFIMTPLYHGLISNVNAWFDVTRCSSVIYIMRKNTFT